MGPHHTKLGKIPLYFTAQKTIIMLLVSLHGTMFLLSLNIRDELNLRVLGRDEPANHDVPSMELNCHLSSQGEKKKVDLQDPDMHFPECSILKLMLYTFTTQPNLVFIHFFFYQNDIYRLLLSVKAKICSRLNQLSILSEHERTFL